MEPVEVPPSFAPVVAAFSEDRRVRCEKGWGSSNVVLKVNGKIFVMLGKSQLIAKLLRARVDELVSKGEARFDPRGDGRLMNEWVVVGVGREDGIGLAREAHDFVRGNG